MLQIFVQKLFIYFLECVAKNFFRVLFILLFILLYYIYYMLENFPAFFGKKSTFLSIFLHFLEKIPRFRNLKQNKCTASCNNCFCCLGRQWYLQAYIAYTYLPCSQLCS